MSSVSSQSAPQSGLLSLVLSKYKQYLQSVYSARALAPADKYLPTLDSPYINLAMIKREPYNTELRDQFTRKTLHGGVDQILQNKVPIDIEDLLIFEWKDDYNVIWPYLKALVREVSMSGSRPVLVIPEDNKISSECEQEVSIELTRRGILRSNNAVNYCELWAFDWTGNYLLILPFQSSDGSGRFILVEGPPGIGKSTFAWEVCRRWDEIESLKRYHTVLLLKLREKWVLNATSLSDLFRYGYDPELSKSITKEHAKTQGKELLLVLDGFDEVSHSFHKDSVIKSILCRQLLPECTIILTTRPVAKSALRSICQPRIDKHVEIIGFTEENRVRYITEVFSEEPELQVNFLKYMFHVPHIKSMMYIPLNCAIIAQVYYESQSSPHLAIPRTRTQLYKALAHSLLVRHMRMKDSSLEFTCMLPEGLNTKGRNRFRVLAKFAFVNYHRGDSRKVTFFKEDVPEGLVHFGFMNESTEMYAGKGVERTLSFLHLSLQEYLAAWYLANGFSIEFQVAYHRLAVYKEAHIPYQWDDYFPFNGSRNEEELILSLKRQSSSLVEPAIFLAGITGWRSEGDRKPWKSYLRRDTADVKDTSVLLRSLYVAQNPAILSHFFDHQSRSEIRIDSRSTPYECYALSYCLAHSSVQFSLYIDITEDDDISRLETFVKGLEDHCKSTTRPRVKTLEVKLMKNSNECLYWLTKAKCWAEVERIKVESNFCESSHLGLLLQNLNGLQYLYINIKSWEWIPALKSLSCCELKGFHITNKSCQTPNWCKAFLDIELPCNISTDISTSVCSGIDTLLKAVRSDVITEMELNEISRETIAGVHSILLNCPCLTRLELKKTRLDDDGILSICSALRNNTALKHIVIHSIQPESEFFWKRSQSEWLERRQGILGWSEWNSVSETTLIRELNIILNSNTTLEGIRILSRTHHPSSQHSAQL